VNPVMTKLAKEGIEVTALHNHLLRAAPAFFYMHVRGYGDPIKLAGALHGGLALSKTPLTAPGAAPVPLELDIALIDRTLGAKGKVKGGVYQLSLKRAAPVSDAGMAVPDTMGTAEAINFLTADEVNPVLQILRAHGIEVRGLHNHMLNDSPRLFFMHFWAISDVTQLSAGLRAALDRVALLKQ
jgi:hypothetical protein